MAEPEALGRAARGAEFLLEAVHFKKAKDDDDDDERINFNVA